MNVSSRFLAADATTATGVRSRPAQVTTPTAHPLSVAPMMDRTDRHFRVFARTLTKRTLLYTEMITANAIRFGDRDRLLAFDAVERPLVLQLGGDDPVRLAEAAQIGASYGYDEINLNCGCPSPRVQAGAFGVVLMARANDVARCVEAMASAVDLPISVKHRVGFDELDSYASMVAFVDTVAAAGCVRFTVHARKAWTQGLSPRQNREIPPLQPDYVYRLRQERPQLLIEYNGGVHNLDAVAAQLDRVDGVMVGRAAWDDPWMLARADTRLYGEASDPAPDRAAAALAMIPAAERALSAGERLGHIVRPMLNLFAGQPGGRRFRRVISEGYHRAGADAELIATALASIGNSEAF